MAIILKKKQFKKKMYLKESNILEDLIWIFDEAVKGKRYMSKSQEYLKILLEDTFL